MLLKDLWPTPLGLVLAFSSGERCRKKLKVARCQLQGDCNLHKNSLVMRQVDKTQQPTGCHTNLKLVNT